MKNVTITLEEEVARWARIMAAKQNTSVSRLVGELLREKMLEEQNYQIAMQQYLSQPPNVLKTSGRKVTRCARRFMTAKVFVDTNVLVYSRDASEPHKQAQAMAWMAHLWQHQDGQIELSGFAGVLHNRYS